jgi:hypothetical protein
MKRMIALSLSLLACATTDGAGALEPAPEYNRKEWRHWIDADKDCQDARQEVLVAESTTPVTFEDERRCRVASGTWVDAYTGKTFTSPSSLDVDHVVALRDAHESGGAFWGATRRRAFANDLDAPEHLRAVDLSANRSKGSRGPDEWLPPNEAFRCQYIREFLGLKTRWGLEVSAGEGAVLDYMLKMCEDDLVPPLPQR